VRIHTFGDSHAHECWVRVNLSRKIPVEIRTHPLGPILMHTFGKDITKVVNLRDYDIQDSDMVVFCFGEIDCRCHIHKFHETYVQTIEDLVTRYISSIDQGIYQLHPKKVKVGVYNVVPPVRLSAIGEAHKDSEGVPVCGTNENRKLYVSLVNTLLEKKCKDKGYIFIDVYSHYSDDQGFIKPSPMGDGIHIKDPEPLIEFLKKLV
jgi:hypothetical protein